jgi:ABC-2 type transport system permease protein
MVPMKWLVICRRELRSYFTSYIAYMLLAVFLVLSGYFFYSDLVFFVLFGGYMLPTGLWQFVFLDMRLCTLLVLPLLTMRLFAEERKLGTIELLWTYPVRDLELIAGKFLACLLVVTLLIAATAVYPMVLSVFQPVAVGPLCAGYLGLTLLGAAFVACGLCVSALTESQLVAGAATYGLLLFFWVVTWNEAAVNEVTRRLLVPFSLFDRFYAFAVGAVDTRNVSYLLLFTTAFLTLTFLALDTRRWRGLRR